MMHKKATIKILKKGERCKEGWTAVEIKIGRKRHRACVRGEIVRKSDVTKAFEKFDKLFGWAAII